MCKCFFWSSLFDNKIPLPLNTLKVCTNTARRQDSTLYQLPCPLQYVMQLLWRLTFVVHITKSRTLNACDLKINEICLCISSHLGLVLELVCQCLWHSQSRSVQVLSFAIESSKTAQFCLNNQGTEGQSSFLLLHMFCFLEIFFPTISSETFLGYVLEGFWQIRREVKCNLLCFRSSFKQICGDDLFPFPLVAFHFQLLRRL